MRRRVKSAIRAIEVLEFFSKTRRPMTLKEIVAGLCYPQSSSTNLLKSLVETGYLLYNRTERRYFPTFRVTEMGKWLDQPCEQSTVRLLNRLQLVCGETVMLGHQNDLYLQYLKVVDSQHAKRFEVQEGSMRLLLQSSLGWMLVSQMNDLAVEKLFRQIRYYEPSLLSLSLDQFQAEMTKARQQGYCYVRNMPLQGGGSVAMLLPKREGEQQLVIGVGGVCDRIEPNLRGILEEMRKAVSGRQPARSSSQAEEGRVASVH